MRKHHMSLDLHDLRAKITLEAKCALRAVARVENKDESEIARKVLHEWALQRIKEAKVMEAFLRSQGGLGKLGDDDPE